MGLYAILLASHLCRDVTAYGFFKDWSGRTPYRYHDKVRPCSLPNLIHPIPLRGSQERSWNPRRAYVPRLVHGFVPLAKAQRSISCANASCSGGKVERRGFFVIQGNGNLQILRVSAWAGYCAWPCKLAGELRLARNNQPSVSTAALVRGVRMGDCTFCFCSAGVALRPADCPEVGLLCEFVENSYQPSI